MGFVGFVASENHWWQTDEFPTALNFVRKLVSQGAEVTAFGSSMGGAGALLSAQFIRISTVLAIAPPIIVDPDHAPWETRFRRAIDLTRQRFPLMANANPDTQTFVVYDPFYQQDVNHLGLIDRAGRRFHRWPLPFSDHSPLMELSKAGLYRDFTTAFFAESDHAKARQILRDARMARGTPHLICAQRRTFGRGRYREPGYVTFLSDLIGRFGPQIEFLDERGTAHLRQGNARLALADYEQCYLIDRRKRYERKVEEARRGLAGAG